MKKTTLWITLLLALCVQSQTQDAFFHIPTADIPAHGSYSIHGRFQVSQLTQEESLKRVYPFVSGFSYGLFNRGAMGLEYGKNLSFAGRMQLLPEQSLQPAFAFGVRSIFGSQEAYLFQLADSVRPLYQGEAYMVLSKSVTPTTRLHGGASIIASLDSGSVAQFYGISQQFMPGLSANLEVFQRDSRWHEALGLNYNFRDIFRFSAGLAELRHWFFQEGQIGFYPSPEKSKPNALHAPAIYVSFAIQGWTTRGTQGTVDERLDKLEEQITLREAWNHQLAARVDHAELRLNRLTGQQSDSLANVDDQVSAWLGELVEVFQAESYDLTRARNLQDSIMSRGELAFRALVRIVENHWMREELRVQSVRLMGQARHESFREPLRRLITGSTPTLLLREVLLTLERMQDSESIYYIENLLSHIRSELVIQTARDVLRSLQRNQLSDPKPTPNATTPNGTGTRRENLHDSP
jgi:hypothetical protein